jgi:hypothetical protein
MTIAEVHQAVSQIISKAFYVHTTNGSIFKLYKDNHNISYRYENLNGIPAYKIKYINNDREELARIK